MGFLTWVLQSRSVNLFAVPGFFNFVLIIKISGRHTNITFVKGTAKPKKKTMKWETNLSGKSKKRGTLPKKIEKMPINL